MEIDPALFAVDPALGGAAGAPAIDPSLDLGSAIDPSLSAGPAVDPALQAPSGTDNAAYQVALEGLPDQPAAVAQGGDDTPEERLRKLRTNYKAAAVSHWATLFLHHAGDEFDVEAFEKDLISNEGDDKFLPHFLGRVLNTLANDRNTNSTNWLNALRRSYNRRTSARADNPFYTWVKVPASVVEAEREAERERDAAEWEAKFGGKFPGHPEDGGDGPRAIWDDEEKKLREAERGLSRAPKKEAEVVKEEGAADVNFSLSAAEAAVPVTEAALDDGFNAEMADAIAADAAQQVKQENGEESDGEDEWYEEQRAVDWKDLSLETKLDAIYNVCEWHMVDPERQFRKYLQWDGESAWRLDPMGTDGEGNKYYQLADDRLWVQRPAPPPNPAQPAGATGHPQVAVKKPKTLLGLKAGPRDKSKKGTVTGTVRVKLKKDKATGRYLQVDEDEQAAAAAPESEAVKGEDGEEEDHPVQLVEEDVEMPLWEQEYWEERIRAENTPGFVEWECVCANLDEWRAFPARFAMSVDPNEIELREKITLEIIPAIEEEQQRREVERQAELEAMARKRSARVALQVSAAEEEARLAQNAERFSRTTRGTARPNYAEDQFGVAASLRGASSSAMGAGGSDAGISGETREERLKKREEEKRRAEEVEALRLAEEAREQQREEARAANGGVLPYELMDEEERAAFDAQQEKERKKREAEDRKRQQEEQKKARARERRAELKAEREAEERETEAAEAAHAHAAQAAAQRAALAAQQQQQQMAALPVATGAVDDPWWMDCEICGLCGWNVDDGQELICCDDCEEWQHLPCHQLADAQSGRAPQPFHDEDYHWSCGRCQGHVVRTGRPPLPNPPNAPLQVISAVTQQTNGKRRASGGAKHPAAKKPKPSKPKSNGAPQQSIPYGHSGHPLYHPSAYSHPVAVQNYTAGASASPVAAHAPLEPEPQPEPQPAAQQEAMSYEQLKAMVEANPALIDQLPEAYASHFRGLMGL
ncbi:hypothetical protein JCM10213_008020 [Rhodosporidiobolus nylandii]